MLPSKAEAEREIVHSFAAVKYDVEQRGVADIQFLTLLRDYAAATAILERRRIIDLIEGQ